MSSMEMEDSPAMHSRNEGDQSAANVPITDNCTQSSGDKTLEKNIFHHLNTCFGQKANLSLMEKTAGFSW